MIAKTEYGNVDVRKPLQRGYCHVPGKRLMPTCRKLGINAAPALVGFEKGYRGHYRAIVNGVVIPSRAKGKLLTELNKLAEGQEKRKEQAQRRRERLQTELVVRLLEIAKVEYPGLPASMAKIVIEDACEVGSGCVGRSTMLEEQEIVRRAVVAYVRHNMTDYEERLRERPWGERRDEWRQFCREEVAEQVRAGMAELEAAKQ